MAGEIQIRVEGVRQLREGLDKVDWTLRWELVRAAGKVGKYAADLARTIATQEGLAPPGRSGRGRGALLREIKGGSRGYTVLLRETAHRATGKGAPFSYPAVYEYGHSRWGHRPFLNPAVRELEPVVVAEVEKAVDKAVAKFGGGE